MKRLSTILYTVLFSTSTLLAQHAEVNKNWLLEETDTIVHSARGLFPKQAKEALSSVQIGGYYRFITNFRKLQEAYPHLVANRNNIFVGDDSQIPQLMLNITGNTSARTQFGTDFYLWSPMTGAGQVENVKGLNLGVSLYGQFSTNLGSFNVRTGGINWYMLSPFTFQSNKGYNRYSVYERNPWDPNTAQIDGRYNDFYSSGAINQDQRWGNQAFQGLIVEGAQLPHRLSFSTMFGRTQLDGGNSPVPNTSFGGKVKKEFEGNANYISFNTFNNRSQTDSIQAHYAGFNMGTIEFLYFLKGYKMYGEMGLGRRFNEAEKTNFGEALSLKISRKVANKYPVELHLYRVSPHIFNNSSIFINSSIQQTTQRNSANQPVLMPVSSAIVPVGQLTNNRQGIELNTQLDFGRFKNNIGYSNSMELDNLSTQITYSHPFNNLALSRFWRWDFPSEVGPYKQLNKIYRSVFETLTLTELDSTGKAPLYKKYFNSIEINSKYKTQLAGKELYIFYLGTFNSAQNKWSPINQFGEKALLRTYDHQAEMYWKLNAMFIWNNYISYERVIANYSTAVDTKTRRPKNQHGFSVATGFDVQLSKQVGLYIRQRWMYYKDSSFTLDHYKGWETTIELKAFF